MKMISMHYWSLFAGTILLGTVSSQAELEDRITKSFSPGAGGKLVMQVDRGSIEIKTGSGDTLNVEVIRKAKDEDVLGNHKIQFSENGNEVQIRSELEGESGRFWKNFGNKLQVKYLITAPKQFNVDLKTSGGSIAITDMQGDVKARTSGGSLKFGKIDGPVWARTSGGSISLEGCKQIADVETSGGSLNIGEVEGPVTAKTSGGSIKIRKAKGEVVAKTSGGSIDVQEVLGRVEAATSGGSVSARLANQPQGDCSLKTSGGSINVELAENISVDLDASTSGGRVYTEMPLTVQGQLKSNAVKAKINGGGPLLNLHTSGGNVRVQKL